MDNLIKISDTYTSLYNNLSTLSNIIIKLEIDDELINKECIFYCINLNIYDNNNNERLNGIKIENNLYLYNAYNSTDYSLKEIKNIKNLNDIYICGSDNNLSFIDDGHINAKININRINTLKKYLLSNHFKKVSNFYLKFKETNNLKNLLINYTINYDFNRKNDDIIYVVNYENYIHFLALLKNININFNYIKRTDIFIMIKLCNDFIFYIYNTYSNDSLDFLKIYENIFNSKSLDILENKKFDNLNEDNNICNDKTLQNISQSIVSSDLNEKKDLNIKVNNIILKNTIENYLFSEDIDELKKIIQNKLLLLIENPL